MRFQKGHSTNVSHGHSKGGASPEYQCWQDIKARCLNPKHKCFKYYGGRGITICKRWKDSFENFLADVGRRPSPKHTIDRFPDNNGNYEPNNVRWATRLEQVDNRRNTLMVMLDGEKIPVTEACRRLGLNRSTVVNRISCYGWTPEEAITPPLWRRPDLSKKGFLPKPFGWLRHDMSLAVQVLFVVFFGAIWPLVAAKVFYSFIRGDKEFML